MNQNEHGPVRLSAAESLERVEDGIVVVDDDLRYTYVNERARQLLDRDDLLGEHIRDVFSQSVDTVEMAEIERAIQRQTDTSFEIYTVGDGRWLTARVFPGADGTTIFLSDVSEQKRARRDLDRMIETVPVGIALLDDEGEIFRSNGRAEDLLGLTRSDIEGRTYDDPDWDIWDDDGDPISASDHPVGHVLSTGEIVQGFVHGITLPNGTERWLSSNVAPVTDGDGVIEQVVVALEDVTVLKRLEKLIDTFQPVEDVLNSATTRPSVEQQVCELLTTTEEYELAWIGEYTPGKAFFEPHASSGPEVDYLDDIEIPMTDDTAIGPTRRAVESGEIQIVSDTGSDPTFAPWREQAADHGLQSCGAVPLAHQGHTYGVLGLYTRRVDAFGEREQALLSTLGDRIGQVIHAIETRQLLQADRVVELTFESRDRGSFLISASADLGCEIDVKRTIQTDENALLHYATVTGASVDDLAALADGAPAVEELRPIHQRADTDGGFVELVLHRQSLAHTLVSLGGSVTTDRVEDGEATVVCEVSPERNITGIVSHLNSSYPETTLVAKREYTPSSGTVGQEPGEILADTFERELTDRQRQAVRAAYHSGFFTSPRDSTATEIADALSLTQSTFSYHLRNAQQKLFDGLFDHV
jgi:PAS domain S-box-containing protein